jgi:hypothetical protein
MADCQGQAIAIDESAVLRRRFLNVFPSRRYQALAHPIREENPCKMDATTGGFRVLLFPGLVLGKAG